MTDTPIYDALVREYIIGAVVARGWAAADDWQRQYAETFYPRLDFAAHAVERLAWTVTPSARRGGKSAAQIKGNEYAVAIYDEVGLLRYEPNAAITHFTIHEDGRLEQHVEISPRKEPSVNIFDSNLIKATIALAAQIHEIDAHLARRADSLVPPPRRNPDRGVRKAQPRSMATPQLNRGRR